MSLPKYFEYKMAFDRMFGEDSTPTKENAIKWAKRIFADLSPENLTCDGELSRTEVKRKEAELQEALAYIENLAGKKFNEWEVFRS